MNHSTLFEGLFADTIQYHGSITYVHEAVVLREPFQDWQWWRTTCHSQLPTAQRYLFSFATSSLSLGYICLLVVRLIIKSLDWPPGNWDASITIRASLWAVASTLTAFWGSCRSRDCPCSWSGIMERTYKDKNVKFAPPAGCCTRCCPWSQEASCRLSTQPCAHIYSQRLRPHLLHSDTPRITLSWGEMALTHFLSLFWAKVPGWPLEFH